MAALVPIGDSGTIGEHRNAAGICDCVRWRVVLRSEKAGSGAAIPDTFGPVCSDHGNIVSLGLMGGLKAVTWARLVIWLIIGMIIYFTYSVKHSKVRNKYDCHSETIE